MRLVTLTSFLEVAHFVGLDPFQLLKEAGISPGLLGDPETRWAAGPIVDLLENSASRSGCESFGILMAECRSFASLGPLSLLLERLPTSRDVLQAVIGHR
ncbi:MAG: AraC family transcriptional regulator, partial [Alphaproteobacteria bacterium]